MKRQLIMIAALAIVCMLLIVGGTYAWYANNHTVTSNITDVQIDYFGASIVDLKIYKYNQETDGVDITTQGMASMTAYDSIFTERNKNTPLVFEISLEGPFTTLPALTAEIDCTSTETDARYTSNLVYVQAASAGSISFSNAPAGETEAEKNKRIFTTVVNFFREHSDTYPQVTFVDKTKNPYVKNTVLAYPSISYKKEDIVDSRLKIFFIMDYDKTLVEHQTINHFSDISIIDNNAVTFENDITSIRFITGQ